MHILIVHILINVHAPVPDSIFHTVLRDTNPDKKDKVFHRPVSIIRISYAVLLSKR